MIQEFQLLLAGEPGAVPRTLNRAGHSAVAVKEELLAAGFQVLGEPVPVRAVVDWSKPHFNLEEAAAFLALRTGKTLSATKATGHVPFSTAGGRVTFIRRQLEAYILSGLNPAGQAMQLKIKN